MTANIAMSSPPPASPSEPTTPNGGSALTGWFKLLRFMLRRDRIRTTVWVLALGLSGYIFAEAILGVYQSPEDIAAIAMMLDDPMMRMLVGPGYGLENADHERLYAAAYVLFIYLPIALFSIFTVIRHTRAEEQTRRAELLRANVVGRHATLTATVVLSIAANLIIGIMLALGIIASGFHVQGALLIGAGGFLTGAFFTGVATVTAQLSESSRTCSSLAGAVLGFAYLLRMVGDMPEAGGTAISWISPLAWPQQTAPFVEDRWWPLLIPAVLAIVQIALGFFLSTKRDVEASMFATRLGRAAARPRLGTPLGMATRTLKGGLRGWGIALVLAGLIFGSFSQAMLDAADDLPPEMAQLLSGDDVMLGYLAFMGVFIAILVAAAAVSGLQQVRGEETHGRAEFALSAPMSRGRWLGSHVLVVLIGVVIILLLTGLGMGLGTAAAIEQDGADYIGDLIVAALLQGAPVVAVLGIVTALFGWLPRFASPIGWLLVGYSGFVTTFRGMLDLPDWAAQLSLFSHLAEYPVEEISWAPVVWLTVIGVAGIALGLIGFKSREVNRI